MSGKTFSPSPLIAAIRAGRLSGVVNALDDGADVEEADIHGCTGLPLRTACFEGDMTIVRELLRHGANPNALAIDGPGAPIRLALRSGHPEIAALLLQYGGELPPGIQLPDSFSAIQNDLPPLAGEATVPVLPESTAHCETDPYQGLDVEELDIDSCRGTDTHLLTLDFMRTDTTGSSVANDAPPGFWQTKRSRN